MKMKRFFSALLAMLMLLSLGAAAYASSEAPTAEDTAGTETETASEETEEADETVGSSMKYYESVTIGGESTGGSFYVYSPSTPHDYDTLSCCMNGVIFVYSDQPVTSIAEALELVSDMGLVSIAEEFPAYIVIPCPLNGETWTEADADVYFEAQFYLAGGELSDGQGMPVGEYDRCTTNTLQYVMAEGSGATFVNNVLSQNATRIAGLLTFGGEMDADTPAGIGVPVWLVNASDEAVAYWKNVNETDTNDGNVYYNSAYEQMKVVVADGGDSFDRETIETAWDTMLSQLMRLGVSGSVIDPTDMSERIIMDWPNLEELGLNLYSFEFDADTGEAAYYTEHKTKSIDSVHLYVPDAAEEDPDEAVPLVVVLHGASDDPMNVVMACGWAQKAAEENFIIVSPAEEDAEYVMAVIEYVESLYNIDTTRVYATGFSMGGITASTLGKTYPDVFAAIAPMGSAGGSYEEGFDNDAYDLPVCMIVGSLDTLNVSEDEDGNPAIHGLNIGSVEQAFTMNEIDPGTADYAKTPYWGYEPDEAVTLYDKGLEWQISSYYSDSYENPVVQCVTLIGAGHSNADYMATIAWDFLSCFSRAADGSLVETTE